MRRALALCVIGILPLVAACTGDDTPAGSDGATSATDASAGDEVLAEEDVIPTLNQLCADIGVFSDAATDVRDVAGLPESADELGNRLVSIEGAVEDLAALPEDARPPEYDRIMDGLDGAVEAARQGAEELLGLDVDAARDDLGVAVDELDAVREIAAEAGADECAPDAASSG